jgi:hypothetical protein
VAGEARAGEERVTTKAIYFWRRADRKNCIWYVRMRNEDGTIGRWKSTGQRERQAAERWAKKELQIIQFIDGHESRLIDMDSKIIELEERIQSLTSRLPPSKKETDKGYIYFIVIRQEQSCLVKIGKGLERKRAYAHSIPYEAEYFFLPTSNRHISEAWWHRYFLSKRIKREWFDLNDEDLLFIKTRIEEETKEEGKE